MRAPVLLQALAPLIVWAELGVGRGGEQRGKLPPRGVTLDRAREHQRGRLWPRNLGASPHSRDLGSSRESGSGSPTRESEREKPRRNTSTPFIRQSLPPGKAVLRVLNLNFWGIGWPLSSDKEVRIRALREELLRGKYDIVLLQARFGIGRITTSLHQPCLSLATMRASTLAAPHSSFPLAAPASPYCQGTL